MAYTDSGAKQVVHVKLGSVGSVDESDIETIVLPSEDSYDEEADLPPSSPPKLKGISDRFT